MGHAALDKMQLRELDRDALTVGAPLPGHIRDQRGRILIAAGQMLDAQLLDRITRVTGRSRCVYVGPDWIENEQDPSVTEEARHAWIVESLLEVLDSPIAIANSFRAPLTVFRSCN